MSVWLPQTRLAASTPLAQKAALVLLRNSQRYPITLSRQHIHYKAAYYYLSHPHVTPLIPLARHYTSSTPQNSSPQSSPQPKSDAQSSVPAEPAKSRAARIWEKVKHEAKHYWDGSKLLVSEVRISSRLLMILLRGKSLTRREKRQLRRTTTDLLRLVPFSVFVIVPFMELLLPVAIKLFPNMLPSTFEDKFAAEEKQRKTLRVRLEMAKFLQETLREGGLKGQSAIIGTEEFKEFFRKVKQTGEQPSPEDIVKVAKLFSNDVTLDNLSRPQLSSICRYLGLNAFGTDNFLKGTIRRRLEHIKHDDMLIAEEGVDELSTSELIHASQSRGLRTIGVSPARLREQMSTWLQLHIQENISGILLILSRAYGLDRDLGKSANPEAEVWRNLEAVMSGLPETLLNEAELAVEAEKVSYERKLEVLREQEELIEDEAEQEEKEEKARRQKREAEERAKREEEAQMARALLPDSELVLPQAVKEEIKDARMTTEQLGELGEALSVLSARSSVMKERNELRALMEENLSADEDPSAPKDPLAKKIRAMLTKIDKQLSAYDTKVGSSLQLIQLDPQGRVSVKDLEQALKVTKHCPEPEVVQQIVKKLDVDDDGFVVLEHVLELIGQEGLGVVIDTDAQNLIGQGREIKDSKSPKPRKEDIVQE